MPDTTNRLDRAFFDRSTAEVAVGLISATLWRASPEGLAAGRIVESLPAGVTVRVVAEIPDDGDRQEWHTEADVSVTWLTRTDDGRSPGVLLDALIGLDGLDSVAYLWSCGETTTSRRIRAHLRRLDSSHDIPGRVVHGRRVLFQTEIIREWVRAGLPDRDHWAALQKRNGRR